MSTYLHRLAVFSARHRALVIGTWLVVLVALAGRQPPGRHEVQQLRHGLRLGQRGRHRGHVEVVLRRADRREPDRLPHRRGIGHRRREPGRRRGLRPGALRGPRGRVRHRPVRRGQHDGLRRRQDRLRQRRPLRATRRPQRRGGRGDPRHRRASRPRAPASTSPPAASSAPRSPSPRPGPASWSASSPRC